MSNSFFPLSVLPARKSRESISSQLLFSRSHRLFFSHAVRHAGTLTESSLSQKYFSSLRDARSHTLKTFARRQKCSCGMHTKNAGSFASQIRSRAVCSILPLKMEYRGGFKTVLSLYVIFFLFSRYTFCCEPSFSGHIDGKLNSGGKKNRVQWPAEKKEKRMR